MHFFVDMHNSLLYTGHMFIVSIGDNATVYGLYNQDITITYFNGNTTEETISGTRYFSASNNILNPSFKLKQTELVDWSTRGWSTGSDGNSSIDYKNNVEFTVDKNTTLYGMYYKILTLSYYDGSSILVAG